LHFEYQKTALNYRVDFQLQRHLSEVDGKRRLPAFAYSAKVAERNYDESIQFKVAKQGLYANAYGPYN
jgi:hypothetical protein